MAAPTYSLPDVGSPNSSEDPKIRTALSDLKTLLTAGLGDANIAAGGIGAASLSSTAVTAANTASTFISSGTYTPTATAGTNVDSITPAVAQYVRIGTRVMVAGQTAINCGSADTTFTAGLTLPIASNFAAVTDASGVCLTGGGNDYGEVIITADTGNDRFTLTGTPGLTSAQSYAYTVLYNII